MNIPNPDDYHVLRHVKFDDYRLLTWETGKTCKTGQYLVGYAFYRPNASAPLFFGEDYGCSPMHSIDSDDCLRGIISFLTLRPSDIEDEYFENYTQDQMLFAENEAEMLNLWGMDSSDLDEEVPGFIDL